MTNKEYKIARDEHESASELYTYEKYNGWYVSRHLDTNDLRELRNEYKSDKKNGAFTLDGFNGRAVIVPIDNGYLLKSYETEVAAIVNGEFYKLWAGYSVTTMKHINAFREWYGMHKISKREWIETNSPEWIETPNAYYLTNMETGEIIHTAAK